MVTYQKCRVVQPGNPERKQLVYAPDIWDILGPIYACSRALGLSLTFSLFHSLHLLDLTHTGRGVSGRDVDIIYGKTTRCIR